MLNDYYGSVFEVEKAEIPDVGQKSSSILASVAITEGIVKEKLKNLKRYSSPGPDAQWFVTRTNQHVLNFSPNVEWYHFHSFLKTLANVSYLRVSQLQKWRL